MSIRDLYQLFCAQNEQMPVFVQPWYLDVVCQSGSWDAIVLEEAGKTVAVLPYFLKQKGPFRYITTPPLCKFMGPCFHPSIKDEYKQQKLLKKLVARLPEVHFYYQQFHYDIQNWLPFYWAGYQQQTRYSYRLENIQDLESTFNGLSADYRNQKIKKAANQLILSTEGSVEECYQISRKSYTRQGLEQPFSLSIFSQLYDALQKNRAGQIFFARDASGRTHSTACLIWDRQSSYLLLAGDDPQFRKSGSGIWLSWELVRYTSEELKLPCFDFLGSMIEPIERVRRQFGAVQWPYHSVWQQYSKWFGLVQKLLGK